MFVRAALASICLTLLVHSQSATAQQRPGPIPWTGGPLGTDAVYYALVDSIPGFAGFIVASTGAVDILLRDTVAHGSTARRVVAAELVRLRRAYPIGQLRSANFDFRQLHDWKSALTAIAGPARITGIGSV